jgi:hypothetical protein
LEANRIESANIVTCAQLTATPKPTKKIKGEGRNKTGKGTNARMHCPEADSQDRRVL